MKTDENPADDASRGLSVEELLQRSKWLTGPAFLWEREVPTSNEEMTAMKVITEDPEHGIMAIF